MANHRRKYSLPGAKGSPRSSNAWIGYTLLALGIAGLVTWFVWPRPTPRPTGFTASPGFRPVPTLPPAGPPPNPSLLTPTPVPTLPPAQVQVSTQAIRWEGPPPPASGVQVSTQVVANVAPPIDPLSKPTAAPTPPWTPRPTANVLEAQLALARHGINSGSIDGVAGAQTEAALRAFQMQHGLETSGRLDRDTLRELLLTAPPLTRTTLSADDFARVRPIPPTWLGKSQAPALDHESILELVSERARTHPGLIRRLNPAVNWDLVRPGTELIVPNPQWPPPRRAARIRVSLAGRYLRAFDDRGRLLCHFPCSIGRIASKRPVGDLTVATAVKEPNYTFDPKVFPESAEGRALGRRLIIPPGPNNPVGVAWIGLDRPGYGIHGTPAPEQVGRTESHGCFRLANWNAEYLRQLVWVGMPVSIER